MAELTGPLAARGLTIATAELPVTPEWEARRV